MLWEADLNESRIKSRIQALINVQAVFRSMRMTSSGSEGWHRSVRFVKVRSNRSRIPWLFGSQRLSQNHQTIEAFEAMPHGHNCIRFELKRCTHVLHTQGRNHWKQKPFTDILARLYRSGEYGPTNWLLWADGGLSSL